MRGKRSHPEPASRSSRGDCGVGRGIPGATLTDFGKNAQYGKLLSLRYWSIGGATIDRFNDFRQILDNNPCPQ
jgi:hypothetical protein